MDKLIEQLRDYAKWAEKRPLEIPILLPVYLRQAADELEKRRWIPVEERLPEKFEVSIVNVSSSKGCDDPYSFRTVAVYGRYDAEWTNCLNGMPLPSKNYERITHWMPLQEAPKEDKT